VSVSVSGRGGIADVSKRFPLFQQSAFGRAQSVIVVVVLVIDLLVGSGGAGSSVLPGKSNAFYGAPGSTIKVGGGLGTPEVTE
jgi:hypothetical protein